MKRCRRCGEEGFRRAAVCASFFPLEKHFDLSLVIAELVTIFWAQCSKGFFCSTQQLLGRLIPVSHSSTSSCSEVFYHYSGLCYKLRSPIWVLQHSTINVLSSSGSSVWGSDNGMHFAYYVSMVRPTFRSSHGSCDSYLPHLSSTDNNIVQEVPFSTAWMHVGGLRDKLESKESVV